MAKIIEEEPLRGGVSGGPFGQMQRVSTFRRLTPQVIVAVIKNLINLNKSLFDGFASIVIPALTGLTTNPNEIIHIAAEETSWLATCTHIGHPFGSLLSGFISDAIGRRKALIFIVAPAVLAFIWLSFADTFVLVCALFFFLSFIFGLKDAPATIYVSEVSEPSVRGTLLAIGIIARNSGYFVIYVLGSFLTWRQVSLYISILPVLIVIAICFIPETPLWLLSKDRPKDAQRSLQWLRGWVRDPELVQDEFTKLQNHNILSTACVSCAQQSIKCHHPKASVLDKIRELGRKRNMKPFILVICLNFLLEFAGAIVWRPYLIQVIRAFGVPMDVNNAAMILSLTSIVGSCFFLLTIKTFGKRILYIGSTAICVLCAVGLSIYGFIFFPPYWTSFGEPDDPDYVWLTQTVGNFGYFAFALMILMIFCTSLGLYAVPSLIHAEVFPFKLRSFLCGLTLAIRYLFASIATKTYFNIEMWFTLSGATLFYGLLSLAGLMLMYFILPETEKRSLEDIELHYSDDTKGITDIHIRIRNQTA